MATDIFGVDVYTMYRTGSNGFTRLSILSHQCQWFIFLASERRAYLFEYLMAEYNAWLPLADTNRFAHAFTFTVPLTVAAAEVVRGSRPFNQEYVLLLSIMGIYEIRAQPALEGPITT